MRASTVPGPLIVTGTAPSATGTVSTAADPNARYNPTPARITIAIPATAIRIALRVIAGSLVVD
jgi:hypothetical protein